MFWRKIIRILLFVILFSGMTVPINSNPQLIKLKHFQENIHPLGHPTNQLLIWENDEQFFKLCQEYKIQFRMAAFQTTLPDPLPGEEYNVGLAAQMLAGTVIQPGQVFSMNGILGPRTIGKGFREGPAYSGSQIIRVIGGGICKVSTTLYNVATLANLEIIERWAHGMLVPYVPPGQDATVSYGTLDIKFRNTTNQPILIWAEKVENTLYMAIYGGVIPPKVKWHHQILYRQKMPVRRYFNPNLPPGDEKIVQSGADGVQVKNRLIVEFQDGKTEIKDLGEDYYEPMPKIIEFGPNPDH